MVISTVNRVEYNGDGSTTAWTYTFPIIDATDIRLTLVASDGTETAITSDYFVDTVNSTVYYPGYAPGAEPVDQPPKVQSGEKLIVYRSIPATQLADLGEKWPFLTIEDGLDKLTMIVQDIESGYATKDSLSTVATSGDYDDLSNKPVIPTVPTDISAFTNDVGYITGVDWDDVADKPAFATVATTGDYDDLVNTPTIPVVPTDISAFTNDAGYITSSGSITGNAATATTANGLAHTLTINSTPFDGTADVDITVGGGGGSYTAGDGIDVTNNVISLETASANDIGGIKVGTNLSVDANGVMSATDTTYTAGTNVSISASNEISATDTTYTGSDGITLTGTNFTNSGVRSVSEGSTNGTISVNTNGTSAEVTVHGLGSNAFDSTSYLPLAGGTMTGTITSTGNVLKNSSDTNAITILGGTDTTSSWIGMWPKNHSTSAGVIQLRTSDGTNNASLLCYPDGTIIWNNKSVATDVKTGSTNGTISVNGSDVSVYGLGSNAFDSTSYLPLAGGTITGVIKSSVSTALQRTTNDSYLQVNSGTATANGSSIILCAKSYTGSYGAGSFVINARNDSDGNKSLLGKADGTLTWNGQAIQTTSDKRLKTALKNIPAAVLDAWGDVKWGEFRYLDAKKEKGDEARLHTGLIAQNVKAVFEAHDLDACKYGLLCHEEWEEERDDNNKIIRKAGDLWMVRYTEALAMEAAYQRKRADKLEKRIAKLEKLISAK